ncbi:hypothetical protein C1Y63_10910 [Corynebacterium sp. 13CS0277]|nr:hypothetical protein C1Y63_10910 [Corynebacterium sp. 13CS0277]
MWCLRRDHVERTQRASRRVITSVGAAILQGDGSPVAAWEVVVGKWIKENVACLVRKGVSSLSFCSPPLLCADGEMHPGVAVLYTYRPCLHPLPPQ